VTKIFFPLRTSVEFFSDPTSVEAAARAKEASILYDEVIFEVGLYDIKITNHGSFNNWRDPRRLTPEDLARSRQLPEPGSGMRIAMGMQPSFNVPAPAEAMRVVLQGEIVVSYAAEWHTGVIEELVAIGDPSWAGYLATGSDSDASLEPLKEARREAERALELAYPQTAKESAWARNFMIKALARDAVVAANLDAAMNVTGLFAPLIESLGAQRDPSGQVALGILVPNVAQLSWEQIAKFRQHAGAVDARGKLREFEDRALASDPDDPMGFRVKLFQEISTAFFAAIHDLAPKFGQDMASKRPNSQSHSSRSPARFLDPVRHSRRPCMMHTGRSTPGTPR
jgi:hypothetical protein